MLIPKSPVTKRPRVLFVLPPFLPTPPPGYGGIESIAAALLPQLHRLGARITVTTPVGSNIKASEVRTITEPLYHLYAQQYEYLAPHIELYNTKVMNLAQHGNFDVVHDFTEVFSTTNMLVTASNDPNFPPVIHTIHRQVKPFVDNYIEFSHYDRVSFTAISNSQLLDAPLRVRQHAQVIHNCINPDDFEIGPGGDRYLVLGRFRPEKGQDRLIEYCVEHNIPLDVAGPVAYMTDLDQIEAEADKGANSNYYTDESFRLYLKIRPLIDGKLIRFYGNVGGELKQRLLRHAKALIVPNRWAEPFGMVAIEAMASGTPVLAMGTGAMPEIVDHGVTGYTADSFEELGELIRTGVAENINRTAARSRVEDHFSAEAIAKQYLGLYEHVAQPAPVTAALSLGFRPSSQAAVLYERLPRRRQQPKSGV